MKKTKIIIVMPAYYAAKTLEKTFREIPKDFVSEIILVDDGSNDETIKIAEKLGMIVFKHQHNLGYGGNQKTCYWEALKKKPDIVIMLHPDYQYDASLLPELVKPILEGRFDMMFGSRIQTRGEAIKGGMPKVKYYLNRVTTLIENILLGLNLSEYMSGLRAYSYKLLDTVPFQRFSNDFVFDQELLISAFSYGFRIGEIPVSTRYFKEASSIGFLRGIKYLAESYKTLSIYLLHKWGIFKSKLYQ